MMGYYNYAGSMMGFGTMAFFMFLFWLVAFVDLILLGAWLWKQLQKK